MRLAVLYLRSRHTPHAFAALAAMAGLGVLWANAMLQVPMLEGNNQIYIPVMFFIPLLSATVIGAAVYSPFGEVERASSRSLPALRLGHMAGLLGVALATLMLAAMEWRYDWAELILARNLAGFAGLAFLGAVLLGSRLSWVVPIVFGITAYRLGASGYGKFAWWAWPMQPIQNDLAWTLALGLLALGLATVALLDARDSPGESE